MKALDAHAAALSPTSYHDFAGLAALKGKAGRAGEGEGALRGAAQQFEAMFLQEMMRTMRQATIKSDLLESNAMETYEGLFDKEVAHQMAKRGGMGLSEVLVQQMKRHVEGAASGEAVLTGAEALQQRQALPLTRPSQAHDLNPQPQRPALPLKGETGRALPGRRAGAAE